MFRASIAVNHFGSQRSSPRQSEATTLTGKTEIALGALQGLGRSRAEHRGTVCKGIGSRRSEGQQGFDLRCASPSTDGHSRETPKRAFPGAQSFFCAKNPAGQYIEARLRGARSAQEQEIARIRRQKRKRSRRARLKLLANKRHQAEKHHSAPPCALTTIESVRDSSNAE